MAEDRLQQAYPATQADYPKDADHALMIGAVMAAVDLCRERGFDYRVVPLDDAEGNHLAIFNVVARSGEYLVRIEKVG